VFFLFLLQHMKLLDGLRKTFNEDQLERFATGVPKPWLTPTIAEGLFIRSAAGTTAYELLRKRRQPYPCTRTLQKHTEHIKFQPGIQKDLIKATGKKLLHAQETGDDPNGLGAYTWISMDEMSHRSFYTVVYST
jgi:hypothetical protein